MFSEMLGIILSKGAKIDKMHKQNSKSFQEPLNIFHASYPKEFLVEGISRLLK